MAYTNAIFYLNANTPGGNDAARSAIAITSAANNGSGLVRLLVASQSLTTGAVIDIAGNSNSNYNGAWIITFIDSTHIDLQASTYGTAGTGGTITPRGGSSWTDAWATITNGPTAARTAAGDTIRIQASPVPTDTGQTATWTGGQNGLPSTINISSVTNNGGLAQVNTNANTYVTGNIIFITGATAASGVNGVWKITNVSTTAFTLGGSVYAATSTVGYCQNITPSCVVLTTAVNQQIEKCDVGWNGGTGVTPSYDAAIFKEGIASLSLLTGAGVTGAQQLAWKAIPGASFTGMAQVSFWMYSTAVIAANLLTINLYTSANGSGTALATFTIPAYQPASQWVAFTVSYGGTIPAGTVQSVGISCTGSFATKTVKFDNIVACKIPSAVDSISLLSLLSKNTLIQGGTEGWWPIGAIGTSGNDMSVVQLDVFNGYNVYGTTAANTRWFTSYYGSTGPAELYKRECILTPLPATNLSNVHVINKAGTIGSLITYSGGWAITDSSSPSGETWYSGSHAGGIAISHNNLPYVAFDHICLAGYWYGLWISSYLTIGCSYTAFSLAGCNIGGYIIYHSSLTVSLLYCINCCTGLQELNTTAANYTIGTASGSAYNGQPLSMGPGSTNSIVNITNVYNSSIAITATGANSTITVGLVKWCGGSNQYGVYLNGLCNSFFNFTSILNCNVGLTIFGSLNTVINGGNITTPITAFITSNASSCVVGNTVVNSLTVSGTPTYNFLLYDYVNFTFNNFGGVSGTIITWGLNSSQFANGGSMIAFQSYAGSNTDHRIYLKDASILTDTGTKHSNSPWSYKINNSGATRLSTNPIVYPLCKVACIANTTYTVKCWIYRSSLKANTGLVCLANQLPGYTTQTNSASGNINTWEQLSISFTPSLSGVVNCTLNVSYTDTTTGINVWVDDVTTTPPLDSFTTTTTVLGYPWLVNNPSGSRAFISGG